MGVALGGDAIENRNLAAGQRDVGIRGAGSDADQSRRLRGTAIRIAGFFERVEKVDESVGGEVWIEREAEQPAIKTLVDLRLDVQERRGEQCAVLNDPHDAVLLPDEDTAVRRKGEADRSEGGQLSHGLGDELRVYEGDLSVCRRRRHRREREREQD